MGQYLFGKPINSLFPWLTENPITKFFGGGETGVDIGLPMGTPITSLTSGRVVGTGYYGGGGVVSVESMINGLPQTVYYQHLDTITTQQGAVVTPGVQLGTSGGQLSGGSHPSISKFSSGPHVEVGLNAPYGSFWNPNHTGPSQNPVSFLASAVGGLFGNIPGTWSNNGPISNTPAGNWFSSFLQGTGAKTGSDFFWRAGLIVGGMTLIVVGLLVFFSHQEETAVTVVGQQAGKAATTAALAA